jgi:hypothetical protein
MTLELNRTLGNYSETGWKSTDYVHEVTIGTIMDHSLDCKPMHIASITPAGVTGPTETKLATSHHKTDMFACRRHNQATSVWQSGSREPLTDGRASHTSED